MLTIYNALQYPLDMRKTNKPLISAIVTNYNGWELGLISDFFESFLKEDYQNFELFFVDNASTDDSIEKVKENFGSDARLKIIERSVNIMSEGINVALNQVKGKYILFLNNDLYFQKGAIAKMVSFMEKNPQVGLVQGKIVSYFDHGKIDDVGETMDIYGNPMTLGAGETDKGQFNKRKEILSATGAASLLRGSLIKKIGILDPDYGIGYEDMDLALRLRLAGYKVYYLPKVLVYHKRGSSTSTASDQVKTKIKYGFNKNRLATLIKNYQASTLLKVLPVVVLIYIATGLSEILFKKLWRFGLSRFQAIFWMLLNMKKLVKKRKKVQKIRELSDSEALLPYMAEGQLASGFLNFIKSKDW
jgi:GT2 family glycosyltransferase